MTFCDNAPTAPPLDEDVLPPLLDDDVLPPLLLEDEVLPPPLLDEDVLPPPLLLDEVLPPLLLDEVLPPPLLEEVVPSFASSDIPLLLPQALSSKAVAIAKLGNAKAWCNFVVIKSSKKRPV